MSETIVGIRSMVITCYSCRAWLGRVPIYYSTGDKGDQCTKCGGSAVSVRDGRPFGPRHRDWDWMVKEAQELLDTFADDEYETREMRSALVFRRQCSQGVK